MMVWILTGFHLAGIPRFLTTIMWITLVISTIRTWKGSRMETERKSVPTSCSLVLPRDLHLTGLAAGGGQWAVDGRSPTIAVLVLHWRCHCICTQGAYTRIGIFELFFAILSSLREDWGSQLMSCKHEKRCPNEIWRIGYSVMMAVGSR